MNIYSYVMIVYTKKNNPLFQNLYFALIFIIIMDMFIKINNWITAEMQALKILPTINDINTNVALAPSIGKERKLLNKVYWVVSAVSV